MTGETLEINHSEAFAGADKWLRGSKYFKEYDLVIYVAELAQDFYFYSYIYIIYLFFIKQVESNFNKVFV